MMVVEDKIKAKTNEIKLAYLGFNMSHAVTDHNLSFTNDLHAADFFCPYFR